MYDDVIFQIPSLIYLLEHYTSHSQTAASINAQKIYIPSCIGEQLFISNHTFGNYFAHCKSFIDKLCSCPGFVGDNSPLRQIIYYVLFLNLTYYVYQVGLPYCRIQSKAQLSISVFINVTKTTKALRCCLRLVRCIYSCLLGYPHFHLMKSINVHLPLMRDHVTKVRYGFYI